MAQRATEDGLLTVEEWEQLSPGPGQHGGPLSQVEWDRDSGQIRRTVESLKTTIHPPERPA